ncbi:MAG: segregation/condensation protein A, partial [Bacillota bacterium]|nr:segregation/condensation protein A [Bacillota bacterium]
ITDQYVLYIKEMEILDLDVASEFLVMAAKLIAIKARMLLPKSPLADNEDGEEIDPREELVNQLLEYQMFKEIAGYLKQQERYSGQIFKRNMDPEEMMELYGGKAKLKNLTLKGLTEAFNRVLNQLNREDSYTEINVEEITIEVKMQEIIKKLFLNENGVRFSELFSSNSSVREVVVTFIALLELAKSQQLTLEQNTLFGDIILLRNISTDTVEEG